MGLWDALRGQSRPRAANLDALFSLPSAALTLEVSLGLHPTGSGSVCFRAAEGYAAAATQDEAVALVDMDGGPTTESRVDEYGFTWLTVRAEPEDTAGLVTDLHAVNSALEAQGFGTGLLCSTVGFRDDNAGAGVPRLPLQAGHVLPVLPDRGEQSRHLAGAADPRRRGGRPALRGGHVALDADLGDHRRLSASVAV